MDNRARIISLLSGIGLLASTLARTSPSGYGTFADGLTLPVPAAAWLFGSGLPGLAGAVRRRS